jgi:cysteine-rich repeat protein
MLRTSRALSLALALAAVATLPACPGLETPNCAIVQLRLRAGECQVIHNACRADGEWVDGDGLNLFPADGGYSFFVQTTSKANDPIERQLCADPGNPSSEVFVEQDYLYTTQSNSSAGQGAFGIDSTRDLQVAVTATPDTVVPGQSAVLEATPSGGLPPYSYQWVPADGVSGQGQFVTATPTATTAYQVNVTDSRGAQQQAFVKVLVTPSLCGDGIVDSPAETCDDGNTKSGDGCSSTCTLETTCQVDAASCSKDADCCSGSCSTKTQLCTAGK